MLKKQILEFLNSLTHSIQKRLEGGERETDIKTIVLIYCIYGPLISYCFKFKLIKMRQKFECVVTGSRPGANKKLHDSPNEL